MVKVLLFGQIRDEKIEDNTLGILAHLKKISVISEIHVLLLSSTIKESYIHTLSSFGATHIHTTEDPVLEHYSASHYSKICESVFSTLQPSLVIASGTVNGEDLLPRIAIRLGLPYLQKITNISWSNDAFHFSVKMRDEQAKLVFSVNDPLFLTTRNGAFFADDCDEVPSEIPIQSISFSLDTLVNPLRVIESKKLKRTVNLKDAKVIVSGGRGVGSKENFELIKKLSSLLNGEIGATRACTDAEWVDETYEIGQTGQAVTPNIYIALGISGAHQHICGVKAKTLIVINKDENAPIFNYCDYAIVEDLHKILPILIEKFTVC